MDTTTGHLSRQSIFLLAVVSAVITANAYYVHPIIALIGEDFGIGEALVGIVPAANQFALALGILLLLPLGDRLSNRRLSVILVSAQTIGLIIMALSQSFWLFVFGSTLLGFFTITPYLLPAFASKRVSATRLGIVTATLTTGVIAGVVLSRTGAGVMAEYLGWRTIYWTATALMIGSVAALAFIVDDKVEKSDDDTSMSYFQLIGSMLGLIQRYPRVLLSGIIQGLSFGGFLAVWMGIGLHVPNELGYGVAFVSYLSLFSAINLFFTPYFGKLADRIGALKTRLLAATIRFGGVLLFPFAGGSYWLLLIPIFFTSIAGPSIDVTGRMTVLDQSPEIRTRLMTVYIVMMFLGGAFGSWGGTIAYAVGGWWGTCLMGAGLAGIVVGLSLFGLRLGSGRAEAKIGS